MELGSIFLLLILSTIVIIFVAQPFSKNWRAQAGGSQEVSSLMAERERTLNALQELDSDKGIGKIPLDEYKTQRASLVQKGSEILRRLDEIQGTQSSVNEAFPVPEEAGKQTGEPTDDELEDMVAQRRASRQQKTTGFCPHCGKPITKSDLFCPSCGQKINR